MRSEGAYARIKFIAIVEWSGWGCRTTGAEGAWSGSWGRGFERAELVADAAS